MGRKLTISNFTGNGLQVGRAFTSQSTGNISIVSLLPRNALHIRSHIAPGPNKTAPYSRRISELPFRESPFLHSNYNTTERRTNFPPQPRASGLSSSAGATQPTNAQMCRNWNYRECRNTQCRYQHTCANCSSSHKATQCSQGGSTLTIPARSGFLRC